MTTPVCPRCAKPVKPATLTEHQYRCPQHGAVPALMPARSFDAAHIHGLARRSEVPVWMPSPMPGDWLPTGLRWAENPRRSAAAVAVGLSGHGLEDGPTDVIIVAEVPGCGLGARYAGLTDPDPGPECFAEAPAAEVRTGRQATVLWAVDGPRDRSAFVGEAEGVWLWIVGWPSSAWGLVVDDLRLQDARNDPSATVYPAGALNPRLADGAGE